MNIYDFFMLAGGLGLFLYGMNYLGEGLERAAGDKMRKLLETLTRNRLMGVLVGTIVTVIIQSSSAVTVMVVGFVNAGLMDLSQALGVILGANIGTTITAQIIALKLTKIAPALVLVGVICTMFFGKRRGAQRAGQILIGLGVLFVGLELMSESMAPLRTDERFISFLVHFKNPILGLLAGLLVTMVIQSSSASIAILQALAMQGLVTLDGSIYILLGMNIGTCVTAMLACVGTSKNAKRAATMHLVMKIIGAAVFMLVMLFVPFVDWVQRLAPTDVVLQIAYAHTIFNIFTTVIMLPFGKQIIWLVKRLVPGKDEHEAIQQLQFMDTRFLDTPPVAVAQLLKEVNRMAEMARKNLSAAMNAFLSQDYRALEQVSKTEESIDFLSRELTGFLVKLSGSALSPKDAQTVASLYHVINDVERIGDHAENLMEFAQQRIDAKLSFSDQALDELRQLHSKVDSLLGDAITCFRERDKRLPPLVEPKEQEIDDLEMALRNKHIERLQNGMCSVRSGALFLDIIHNLERVGDHATNVAYSILEP